MARELRGGGGHCVAVCCRVLHSERRRGGAEGSLPKWWHFQESGRLLEMVLPLHYITH